MKKIFGFIAILFLASCAKISGTDTSVWAEGGWILPWVTGIGSVIFAYQAYKGSKAGSNIVDPNGAVTDKEGGNVPIWKFGQFWFSVALAIATIIIIISFISNK